MSCYEFPFLSQNMQYFLLSSGILYFTFVVVPTFDVAFFALKLDINK